MTRTAIRSPEKMRASLTEFTRRFLFLFVFPFGRIAATDGAAVFLVPVLMHFAFGLVLAAFGAFVYIHKLSILKNQLACNSRHAGFCRKRHLVSSTSASFIPAKARMQSRAAADSAVVPRSRFRAGT